MWVPFRKRQPPGVTPPRTKPAPPPAPPPLARDLSFAERFAAEWRRQWGRPQPTRTEIDQARERRELAARRAQEDALIRDAVRGHGVIWRSDREGTPTLPGYGRLQSFAEYARGTVLDGER